MRWLLALTVAALAAAGCAGPLAHRAPDVIAVTGRGQVAVKPDTALVRLGAETRRPALADATADVAQRMTAVLERLRAAGVRAEDVTTVRYAVTPLSARRPDGGDDPARIAGYHVVNVVEARVRDVGAVGRVVDAAVAAGATVIQDVRFTVADRRAAEARAREQAVAEARRTATELARAAGVALGPLVSLSEGVAAPPVPVFRASPMALSATAPGPIEAGEQEVVVTVEASYRIGPAPAR
jgi:uncharacterized protein YggE